MKTTRRNNLSIIVSYANSIAGRVGKSEAFKIAHAAMKKGQLIGFEKIDGTRSIRRVEPLMRTNYQAVGAARTENQKQYRKFYDLDKKETGLPFQKTIIAILPQNIFSYNINY